MAEISFISSIQWSRIYFLGKPSPICLMFQFTCSSKKMHAKNSILKKGHVSTKLLTYMYVLANILVD